MFPRWRMTQNGGDQAYRSGRSWRATSWGGRLQVGRSLTPRAGLEATKLCQRLEWTSSLPGIKTGRAEQWWERDQDEAARVSNRVRGWTAHRQL
jgi:hypothetical protein